MINKKLFLNSFLFSATIIFSCKTNTSKKEFAHLKILHETLENSSSIIQKNSGHIYARISDDFKDPIFSQKVSRSKVMADYIVERSDDLIGQIKDIKKILYDNIMKSKDSFTSIAVVNELNEQTHFYNDLYNNITTFKKDILSRDSNLRKEFEHQEVLSITKDQVSNTQTFSFELLFKDKAAIEVLVNLSQLENRVAQFEYNTLVYYNSQYCMIPIIWDKYSLLIAQSKEEVKAGSSLEITAGIGTFSTQIESFVKIGGKEIEVTNGAAVTTVNVSKIPGKYSVPVHVEYTEADGKKVTKTSTIRYTVVE